jgi:long-chain acyl-CoA synthetase
MERIWLKHYPPGVSAEIDPSRYASLVAMLEESFAKHRERTAFICMDKALSYGETARCHALSGLGCRAEAWRRVRASPS